ncbi:hypothetical protein [Allosphingosinicella indica]|uniref:Uncharacterized protein n=1 Tax=Allosphingosinicella indica TaxID=941907 RepID=A0A1X7GJ26_9SPHN|nr:hypothetical protein [Allosphingosinicella indica]SMF70476.1 hypothetical protein SAMN06295910_1875 [Allosphingosinicella indica]
MARNAWRLILAAAAGIILLAAVLHYRGRAREEAAAAKLGSDRAAAAQASAGDAVNSVAGAAQREAASDALTRSNEKEIRDAKGADVAVDPAVRDAGLDGLCRRAAYRDSERCRMREPDPR